MKPIQADASVEWASIDEAANSYLRHSDIPERPTGYRWFQRLPNGRTLEEVESAIGEAFEVSPPPSMHPRHVMPVMRDVLDRLYGRAPDDGRSWASS
jgi:hypothetical protein